MMPRIKQLLPAAALAFVLGATTAEAELDERLILAIGAPGSDSFVFGTELWAMIEIALKPTHGVSFDALEVEADDDRLAMLRDRKAEAALVYGRVPFAYAADLRAIMALWPGGAVAGDVDPVQFLVRKDVGAEAVYLLTKAMFENADLLKTVRDEISVGALGDAVTGLDVPLHPGAHRYYAERGFGFGTASAFQAGPNQPAQDSAKAAAGRTYRDFDDAALSQAEIDQIVAACRQALELGTLSAVLGDLSSTGCEVYQQDLASFAGEQAPTEAVENEPFDAAVGQGGPAIRWDPESGATSEIKTSPSRQPVM
jgi:hypothetical protein